MIRIRFEGDDLADFESDAPDDHVKMFFPDGEGVVGRDYTPRAFDRAARTLSIDFVLHDAGPATQWAAAARVGDMIDIGGPRGSAVVSPTFDWWLLVGDETALPAIARRLEELPAGIRAVTLVAVADAAEEQRFETRATLDARWVHRPPAAADDPAPILDALRGFGLPEGEGFVWIAAEAGVAHALRDYLVGERGHALEWTKASGYWLKGVAGAH
jgi:NADPH-dependent ferric siderophore reductase